MKNSDKIQLKSSPTINEMCDILEIFGIKSKEYTDCTILYEVTFEQLRLLYNFGNKNV